MHNVDHTSKSDNPMPPSAFARVAFLVYALLIVYASWYPFTGWRSAGVSPTAYLLAPLPHYWTMFDFLTNVIGYAPLGLLAVYALYPKVRGIVAFLLAFIVGVALSGMMEAVQTFLPSRVPSNLDLMTNTAGVAMGALIGVVSADVLLRESWLALLRRRWFSHQASRGLIVMGLWPLAQIYPQAYFLGHGQVLPMISDKLSQWLSIPVNLGDLLRHGKQLTVEQYWLSETIITACGVSGAVLTLLCVLQDRAPKMFLALSFLLSAVIVKILASALQFSPDNAFAWVTPGAQAGFLLGLVMLSGLIFAPPVAQRRVAALTLVMSLFVINVVPENPYFLATLQAWVQGKFLNFNGAAQFLSLSWPFLALWFLLHPVHRQ